eukprot:SAG11_NODE_38454_length_252_cov_0.679739_1_plen_34_part_10
MVRVVWQAEFAVSGLLLVRGALPPATLHRLRAVL